MKLRDIFTLGVRLMGLFFFCYGLKGLEVPTLLDVTFIRIDKPGDIVSTILPVIFNLATAWWLLGSSLLIRRAYPEPVRI